MFSLANISRLVGSSQYRAFADDGLKDEDNAAWVMGLEPRIRDRWIQRISWIRGVDRRAENEVLEAGNSEFWKLRAGWQRLRMTGQVVSGCPHEDFLIDLRSCWFCDSENPIQQAAIAAWDEYLTALMTYHQPNLAIETLVDYEAMLESLAGRFFQILPFLSEQQQQAVTALGIVDQFYNNLRDLREDAEQGICYFPTQVLARFGVSRKEILQRGCFDNPGYFQMMHFWLDRYLPQLRWRTSSFLLSQDLHPSWQQLINWSLRRYCRIESIFRQCDFNYEVFPKHYWAAVKQDLAHWQSYSSDCPPGRLGNIYTQLRLWWFLGFTSTALRSAKNLIMATPKRERSRSQVGF